MNSQLLVFITFMAGIANAKSVVEDKISVNARMLFDESQDNGPVTSYSWVYLRCTLGHCTWTEMDQTKCIGDKSIPQYNFPPMSEDSSDREFKIRNSLGTYKLDWNDGKTHFNVKVDCTKMENSYCPVVDASGTLTDNSGTKLSKFRYNLHPLNKPIGLSCEN